MNKKKFLSKGSIAGAILLAAAAIGFVSLNREPAGPGNEGTPVIAQEAEAPKPAHRPGEK